MLYKHRLLSARSYKKTLFWALHAHFKASKNFSGKSICFSFLFLDFYHCAKFQKNLINGFPEKLVTDVHTDRRANMNS